MHDFQEQCQAHVRTWLVKNTAFGGIMRLLLFSLKQCIIKQLWDSVFVISEIIKVSVNVISLSFWLRLITLTSTLIILDITKTSSNNCLKLYDFSGKTPMIRATTLERKHYKIMPLAWFLKLVKLFLLISFGFYSDWDCW